jgi:hypothetical protein
MAAPTFHAEKPTLITHPVVGGDALSFPISPTPPLSWWIELRTHAHANPVLVRPWDERKDDAFIVESPTPSNLNAVIDAVDAAVAHANADYQHDGDLREAEAVASNAEEVERDHARQSLQTAIDRRYDPQMTGAAPF